MPNQKKRTAWSVQDVVNGKANAHSNGNRFKSGYSGPKRPSNSMTSRDSGRGDDRGAYRSSQSGYGRKNNGRSSGRGVLAGMGEGFMAFGGSGIMDYAWIVYSVLLTICLSLALGIYSANANKIEGYVYPSYIFSMTGVINAIYDDYAKGGLGTSYNQEMISNASNPDVDKDALLGGTSLGSTLPNTTTGATMALDTGSTYGEFGIASSYDELITQLDKAMANNDFGFVGMKLSYQDEETGNLIGYPQSVVENFTQCMADNSNKREEFLSKIKDESTYCVKNGSAYLIKLPILKFTINMGYDNTIVSVSGFSDIEMNSGQSATVSPILPCMYTITVSTNGGSQSQELEADMDEGNLQVNIGVTK